MPLHMDLERHYKEPPTPRGPSKRREWMSESDYDNEQTYLHNAPWQLMSPRQPVVRYPSLDEQEQQLIEGRYFGSSSGAAEGVNSSLDQSELGFDGGG